MNFRFAPDQTDRARRLELYDAFLERNRGGIRGRVRKGAQNGQCRVHETLPNIASWMSQVGQDFGPAFCLSYANFW